MKDPIDRAANNARLCLGLLMGVLVLGLVFGVLTGDPRLLTASAVVGGGGSVLVFLAFWSGSRS